jgi:hypothetical protein
MTRKTALQGTQSFLAMMALKVTANVYGWFSELLGYAKLVLSHCFPAVQGSSPKLRFRLWLAVG